MEQTDTLIIGGGLSGLTAAWQLRQAGIDASLLEARSRFGGRVWTVGVDGESRADCDMGPSWFWPGQPLVAGLLDNFGIAAYEQHAAGTTLFQQMDGSIVPAMNTSPMAGALRVEGGIQRLAEAIASEIDPAYRLLNHVVTGLAANDDGVTVAVTGPDGAMQIEAKRVAVAIPPRVAAGLTFSPMLPTEAWQALSATPTWMAGHAKFFAIYAQPFWREKGLCGSAISQRGPLAEMHDASPKSGRVGALFGFAGLDAASRASMGQEEFVRQAVAQLVSLFGDEASSPTAIHFQDWSTEAYTASSADRQPPAGHPQYGLDLQLGDAWAGKLDFISSETSFSNGGLIEGALESGLRFSKRITG